MGNLKIHTGNPFILGASIVRGGVNFSLFVKDCEKITLLLSKPGHNTPVVEFDFDPLKNRSGDIWHLEVEGDVSECLYAYKIYRSAEDDSGHLVLDPYARYLSGGEIWGDPHVWFCGIVDDNFDWQGDRPLARPMADTIIYEMHVRSFTCHHSAGVRQAGAYMGVVEKIPYLKKLGITALELLPVAEFDENENPNYHSLSGQRLKNLWGYSPLAFFAPKAAYATVPGEAVLEFKTMVRELHRAGIEVILDVVFNHTGEGDDNSSLTSFRKLAGSTYYMRDADTGVHLNFTGCGNTMNCNHPVVRRMIIDCLRYWVVNMHVDGFRFDLASIFSRGRDGAVIKKPPLVEEIAEDPILSKTKLIAEAWDAAGLYQVGSFADTPRWSEWNGRFRDDVRAFLCGHDHSVSKLATRLAGSADLFQNSGRKPYNSINFITSHDGFTLRDLVSYNQKHNENNGENNQDGENHNISWNSGKEGSSKARKIVALRERRIRMAALILLLSQGTPMLLAGDEFGRSQGGNNNAYCQDNEISWLNWDLTHENEGLLRFFRGVISLRKKHAIFRRQGFFAHGDKEIIWQGVKKDEGDWHANASLLCCLMDGRGQDNDFFLAFNGGYRSKDVELPDSPNGQAWRVIVDTSLTAPHDIVAEENGVLVRTKKIALRSRSVVVLIGWYED